MKDCITLFIAFVLTAFPALNYSQCIDSLKSKKIIVATSLFDFFPNKLNASNFNLGTEIYLKCENSVVINAGLIKSNGPAGGWLQIASLNTQGMKIQIEGKHYLNKRKIVEPAILLFWPHIFQYNTQRLQNAGYYLAANLIYQTTVSQRQETVVDYIDNKPFPNSYHCKQNIYTVNRTVYTAGIKFGYHCVKKYGLTIDYAVGLGAQCIMSKSQNRIGTDENWPNSQNDFPWKKLFDNGTGIYPDFIYQLKLGWAF